MLSTWINSLLRQFEIVFSCWILLLYLGTEVKVGNDLPIEEVSLNNHDGILTYITIVIIVFTIILGFKNKEPDIVITGPMTQQEYINLQDVLAYQA